MPNKKEKESRKKIKSDLQIKASQEFENNLPLSRDIFKNLFDYLDSHLNEKGCDNTNILTKTFLLRSNNQNVDKTLQWLSDHGGSCDCEILANIEEQFD